MSPLLKNGIKALPLIGRVLTQRDELLWERDRLMSDLSASRIHCQDARAAHAVASADAAALRATADALLAERDRLLADLLRVRRGYSDRWCTELNKYVAAIDLGISTASFTDYVHSIDDLCAKHVDDATRTMGTTPAKLFLLKLSNLLVAKYQYLNRHIALIAHPVGLIVDTTNNCGLRCPGCVHSGGRTKWDWPPGLLKEDVFRGFLDEHGPYAIDLYLASYGEPLLSRSTPKFVQLARRCGLPTFASTSLSFPPHLLEGVVESGLNFLILSIDGATEPVYSRFRRNGNFEQVISNVRQLVDTKRRLGSYTPVLYWQFLVFEHNVHEIDAVKRLARDLGVNSLGLVRPFSVAWDDPTIRVQEDWTSQIIEFNYDNASHVASLATMCGNLDDENIARHFARTWADRLSSVSPTMLKSQSNTTATSRKPCGWLYKSLTMDAHGRIMPCTRAPAPGENLVFSRHTSADQFNSSGHRLARRFFADPETYVEERDKAETGAPYCELCVHPDLKPDIDTRDTCRRILYDANLFDALTKESKDMLTDW